MATPDEAAAAEAAEASASAKTNTQKSSGYGGPTKTPVRRKASILDRLSAGPKKASSGPKAFASSEEESKKERSYSAGTFLDKVGYYRRYFMGQSMGLCLVAISAVLFCLSTALWLPAHSGDGGVQHAFDVMWGALMFILDPGNMAPMVLDLDRGLALLISIGGIFFNAVIIGFIVDTLINAMDEMRLGKGAAVEAGHHLILGWSDMVMPMLEELCADAGDDGAVVVIMSGEETPDMLRCLKEVDWGATKVICRTGDPALVHDLERCRAWCARNVIIVSEPGDPQIADVSSLRVLLALRGIKYRIDPGVTRVLAELQDSSNKTITQAVAGSPAFIVVNHEFIGRLMVAALWEPGIVAVWEQLLSFKGSEMYLKEWKDLTGKKWSEITRLFESAIPIGVRFSNPLSRPRSERSIVYPKPDAIFKKGEELVVIASDNDSYEPKRDPTGDLYPVLMPKDPIPPQPPVAEKGLAPRTILVCGLRRNSAAIFELLGVRLAPNSEIYVVSEAPVLARVEQFEDAGLNVSAMVKTPATFKDGVETYVQQLTLDNGRGTITLRHIVKDPTHKRTYVRGSDFIVPIKQVTGVLVLADLKFDDDPVAGDSYSMSCMMMVRNLQTTFGVKQRLASDPLTWTDDAVNVVCEIRDLRTRQFLDPARAATVSGLAEFALTNTLGAGLLAMFATKRIGFQAVLESLLSASEPTLQLNPVGDYLSAEDGRAMHTFWEMSIRTFHYGVLLIGYWPYGSRDPIINPEHKHEKRQWHPKDQFIAIVNSENKVKRRGTPSFTASPKARK